MQDRHVLIRNACKEANEYFIVAAIQNCQLRRDLQLLNDPNYKNLGQAITIRFKKRPKGWYVFVSTDISLPPPITSKEKGVIGVDINSDHLAVIEIDRFGNALPRI